MLPLEGIKVVDLSRLLPGPFCSMILGDMGAEIIKVEEPPRGQGRRTVSLSMKEISEEEKVRRAAYEASGRNKKSIVVDLKTEKGREIVYRLTAKADVFLEEFRPGVVERLKVDYETLSRINPGIIYCSISLYGQDGPYRDIPGHDPCARAVAGMLDACQDRDGRPIFSNVPVVDISTALHAVIGILLALRVKEKTGQGQHVDISMTDSALDFMYLHSRAFFRDGRSIDKKGATRASSGVFPTKDGKYICMTNLEFHHWVNFCRAIGREDLIPYHTAKGERAEEIAAQLAKVFMTRTREEWFRLAAEVDTQLAPVNEVEEAFEDPQVRHREMVVELDHPLLGKVRQLGISIKLRRTPGRIRSFAPLSGQHTREILDELGYSAAEVEELYREGVVA